ncbi:Spo0E family sporulation regulatory protein-aspartic acid phosphatase [Desulfosporosinus nitroreducens]|uniref:Aspartyl-phosphate phosphatase Spo0E family protein n=1 Tax=Desulfosporosinus nitroreducens TaxID=2018668 RepID=A0ABT8QKW0_9FIRM|nr:aspartyl-phosphate phosphatase Spo0E family protein [Desulfosporosinus nitroreducens]MCO1601472.1 aspartyl-phosphate phosphatase Spo0E family protein [Desulfosporosinus nitroreducens]MDO0821968.1 aspartyl-phosphate phosphatase Spo0E family protein [Desulfosporosinus nitroreducens]
MIFEDIEFLIHLIEDARVKLNASAKHRSLTDPSIIEMSQRLDSLINKYYSITETRHIAS